ncbi:2-alkenal reductase (NADP(+)-dependent)-like isoform X1 [Zingiber officinale]|uniref:2-alkenal reductase (NADP(+)-dependent)-like isoform X1 n=1 Tax=Zingiber officinale TaxID=94328 RepID=UPI001C4C9AA6|nr:2-alkenal reductase (NADP(+)-dependent)-like isoform X1 [Zingiber officinale]
MEVVNKYVSLKHHVDGYPSESDFELSTTPLQPAPGSGEVIVKNLYLSIDPYQLDRMKRYSSSHTTCPAAAQIEPEQARVAWPLTSRSGNAFVAWSQLTTSLFLLQRIDAYGVGKVVASGRAELEEGDVVAGLLGWEQYTVVRPGTVLMKVDAKDLPLSCYASVLGTSGLTAFAGFYDVCKPKKGEKVFVSAASGSVGSLVGQYAKLSGCYVVGCAGSKQKVDLLKGKLGFDDAFNYKEEADLKSALRRYFPEGIDIYFDNVGAAMLEAAVANMNPFGRVAVCGAISEYTNAGKRAAPDLMDVIYKRITLRGFLALDYLHLHEQFSAATSDHLRRGRMTSLEDVSVGIESLPTAFVGLFRGDNVGKKLVRVGELEG